MYKVLIFYNTFNVEAQGEKLEPLQICKLARGIFISKCHIWNASIKKTTHDQPSKSVSVILTSKTELYGSSGLHCMTVQQSALVSHIGCLSVPEIDQTYDCATKKDTKRLPDGNPVSII